MSCREKQLLKEKLVWKTEYHNPKFIGNGIARTARKRRAEYLIKRERFKVEYLRKNPSEINREGLKIIPFCPNANTAVSLLKFANPKSQPFRHLTFYGIEEVEKIL